ncbi:SAF domain-containing protein [Jatrophihabitans telluris]|uniref:SAF domain-containing protein n=1 Tax=Jatrophihabitans telluris TaxID=2038343 RepID=A0ABY4R252_9ACTN|nr:SAF domain-containing protein [Jatrophihabitans telluris]UQX89236.1 SAF domain-containing protein [Jatrophihabitans telluris]
MIRSRLHQFLRSPGYAAFAAWPRRVLALLCLGLAAASAISSRSGTAHGPGPSEVNVAVAATELVPGQRIAARDVLIRRWPPGLLPARSSAEAARFVGRQAAGRIPAGQPLTPDSLLDTTIAAGLSDDQVAAAIELSGTAQTRLVHTGARVDLYASDSGSSAGSVTIDGQRVPAGGGSATTEPSAGVGALARAVRVLAVLGASDAAAPALGTEQTTAIVVAVTPAQAARLATQAPHTVMATLRPP